MYEYETPYGKGSLISHPGAEVLVDTTVGELLLKGEGARVALTVHLTGAFALDATQAIVVYAGKQEAPLWAVVLTAAKPYAHVSYAEVGDGITQPVMAFASAGSQVVQVSDVHFRPKGV